MYIKRELKQSKRFCEIYNLYIQIIHNKLIAYFQIKKKIVVHIIINNIAHREQIMMRDSKLKLVKGIKFF